MDIRKGAPPSTERRPVDLPASISQPDVLKSIVRDGYDKIADKYLAWSAPRPTLTRIEYLNRLIDILPKGAKVLELGCGAGVPSTQIMIKRGFDVTATDISSAQLTLAKEHIPEATLIQSDMMSLDFPPRSFDAVVAFYSVFHLPKDEQGKMVERMADWLTDGGWLLFNLNTNQGDFLIDDWMGARMFSASLGVQGNNELLEKHGQGLKIVSNEVADEIVGGFVEKFHWVFATKA
jgi:SAM-dependent methyltransferase